MQSTMRAATWFSSRIGSSLGNRDFTPRNIPVSMYCGQTTVVWIAGAI